MIETKNSTPLRPIQLESPSDQIAPKGVSICCDQKIQGWRSDGSDDKDQKGDRGESFHNFG
jgi:hypothetical protein